MQKRNAAMFKLTGTAVMVAMSVILCRYLGFSPQDTPLRFEIGFYPIALVAYAFGPLYSAISYALADIIGSLLSGYAPNLWLTLGQTAFGAVMGLFFYKKDFSIIRTSVCFSVIAIFIETLLKAPVFIFMYAYTPGFAFGSRALNALINLPLRIALTYFLGKAIKAPMKRFTRNL
jgi:ECF transporter S component (folate family)